MPDPNRNPNPNFPIVPGDRKPPNPGQVPRPGLPLPRDQLPIIRTPYVPTVPTPPIPANIPPGSNITAMPDGRLIIELPNGEIRVVYPPLQGAPKPPPPKPPRPAWDPLQFIKDIVWDRDTRHVINPDGSVTVHRPGWTPYTIGPDGKRIGPEPERLPPNADPSKETKREPHPGPRTRPGDTPPEGTQVPKKPVAPPPPAGTNPAPGPTTPGKPTTPPPPPPGGNPSPTRKPPDTKGPPGGKGPGTGKPPGVPPKPPTRPGGKISYEEADQVALYRNYDKTQYYN